jgi:hypothetical protein
MLYVNSTHMRKRQMMVVAWRFLTTKSKGVLQMAESKCTSIVHLANPEDEGWPRMVTLFRGKESLSL